MSFSERVHVLRHPLGAHKLSLLRDKNTTSKQIRELIGELAQLLLTEAMSTLTLTDLGVRQGPLASYQAVGIKQSVGLIPVMRSGLAMVDVGLTLLPTAHVYHLGMYREKLTLQPVEYYNKLSEEHRVDVCFVLDPLIATGGTSLATVSALKDWGAKEIKFVCICASKPGLEQLLEAHPDVHVYTAVIDEFVDERGYVIPGIGDAGDRLYKTSLD
jgi:uracil phosphoribosyltransferase